MWSHHFMANRWGKKWLTVTDFIFLGSKIIADGDCSHEIKKMLVPWRASLVPQLVKNLPAMRETWVKSLGWKAPLENGMATHSSILAGESYGLVHGVVKSRTQLSIPWKKRYDKPRQCIQKQRHDLAKESVWFFQ